MSARAGRVTDTGEKLSKSLTDRAVKPANRPARKRHQANQRAAGARAGDNGRPLGAKRFAGFFGWAVLYFLPPYFQPKNLQFAGVCQRAVKIRLGALAGNGCIFGRQWLYFRPMAASAPLSGNEKPTEIAVSRPQSGAGGGANNFLPLCPPSILHNMVITCLPTLFTKIAGTVITTCYVK